MRPSDLVQPDPEVNEKILALITRAYPLIADSFNRHLGTLAVRMFDDWPVLSGLSKSLLDLEYDVTDTTLGGSVVCRAPYAYFIREAQQGKRHGRERRLSPEELAIMAKPPRGVSVDAWKQAIVVGSRQVDLVSYAYAVGVVRNIKKASSAERAPRGASPTTSSTAWGAYEYREALYLDVDHRRYPTVSGGNGKNSRHDRQGRREGRAAYGQSGAEAHPR